MAMKKCNTCGRNVSKSHWDKSRVCPHCGVAQVWLADALGGDGMDWGPEWRERRNDKTFILYLVTIILVIIFWDPSCY